MYVKEPTRTSLTAATLHGIAQLRLHSVLTEAGRSRRATTIIHSGWNMMRMLCANHTRSLRFAPATRPYWDYHHRSPKHSSMLLVGHTPERYCYYSTSIFRKDFNPHAYTSGRWLRRDKLEQELRHIEFDFEALRRRVVELSRGADSILNCRKIEGGFNRFFIFELDNSKRIVARLPFALAGPARLTVCSEVATIRYRESPTGISIFQLMLGGELLVQTMTTIPIPAILDWNDDAASTENAIGSEYIILEHACSWCSITREMG